MDENEQSIPSMKRKKKPKKQRAVKGSARRLWDWRCPIGLHLLSLMRLCKDNVSERSWRRWGPHPHIAPEGIGQS
jgi:hypothetical protein